MPDLNKYFLQGIIIISIFKYVYSNSFGILNDKDNSTDEVSGVSKTTAETIIRASSETHPKNADESFPSIQTANTYDHLVVLSGTPNQALRCELEPGKLTIVSTFNWQWTHNGQPLNSNATSNEVLQIDSNLKTFIIFSRMDKSHSGNYTCICISENGSRSEVTQKLDVIDNKNLAPFCVPLETKSEHHLANNITDKVKIESDTNDNDTSTNVLSNTTTSVTESSPSLHRQKRFVSYFWARPHTQYYNHANTLSPLPDQNLQELVNLVARRLLLADRVAIAKWDKNQAIEDAPREQIILQNVVTQAQSSGLDVNWARSFFRDQIEANKDVQNVLFVKWRKFGGRSRGPSVNLAKEVRPLIDEINTNLMLLSKQTEGVRKLKHCQVELEQNARYTTFLYSLDHLHQHALQRALSNVCIV